MGFRQLIEAILRNLKLEMRFLFPIYINLAVLWIIGYAKAQKKSNGLVFDFIESNSNFLVDPCDDFAAHVCPDGGDIFINHLEAEYNKIWEIQAQNGHRLQRIWNGYESNYVLNYEVRDMLDFMSSRLSQIPKLCSETPEGKAATYNVAKMLDDRFEPKVDLKNTCEELGHFIRTHPPTDAESLTMAYKAIIRGAVGIAVHEYIQNETERFHQLSFDIKNEFIELLKATPWVKNKKAISAYIDKLNQVTINDFGTIAESLEEAILEYEKNYNACVEKTNKILCRLSAIHIANEMMAQNPYLPNDMFVESATDDVNNIYNMQDGIVYFGNAAELLIFSDMVPAFYGVIGFIMSHELMHTFVFDEKDYSDLKDLWTQETQCIQEQTFWTCRRFKVNCAGFNRTFEEDAADLNGVRLAWNVYQKQKKAVIERTGRFSVQRKKIIHNAIEISDDQLFFYANGLFFCTGKYRNSYTYRELENLPHSMHQVRINNIASQMDQFHQAFGCRNSQKMVVNKVSNCVQYGSEAPERKGADEGSKI